MMQLLSVNNVETDNGEYVVELFDITAYVAVYKQRKTSDGKPGLVYQQKIRFGSQRFVDAVKTLIRRSAPGSLTREHLEQCDCTLVRNLIARA
jgi:hypothetical protein